MKSDKELREIAERIEHFHLLPRAAGVKKFLAVCGDLTSEEIKRLGDICEELAHRPKSGRIA